MDTNLFVEALSAKHPYHRIVQGFRAGEFSVCLSNSILLEYEETLLLRHGRVTVQNFLGSLSYSLFVVSIDPLFRYTLITADPDDNKFVDCAVAANADYIVTSDHHFDILRDVSFPKVAIIHPEEFIRRFLQ